MSIEQGGFDNLSGVPDSHRVYGGSMSDVSSNPEGSLYEHVEPGAVSALGQAFLSKDLSLNVLEHSKKMALRYWGGRDFYGNGIKGSLPGVTSPDYGE